MFNRYITYKTDINGIERSLNKRNEIEKEKNTLEKEKMLFEKDTIDRVNISLKEYEEIKNNIAELKQIVKCQEAFITELEIQINKRMFENGNKNYKCINNDMLINSKIVNVEQMEKIENNSFILAVMWEIPKDMLQ